MFNIIAHYFKFPPGPTQIIQPDSCYRTQFCLLCVYVSSSVLFNLSPCFVLFLLIFRFNLNLASSIRIHSL